MAYDPEKTRANTHETQPKEQPKKPPQERTERALGRAALKGGNK